MPERLIPPIFSDQLPHSERRARALRVGTVLLHLVGAMAVGLLVAWLGFRLSSELDSLLHGAAEGCLAGWGALVVLQVALAGRGRGRIGGLILAALILVRAAARLLLTPGGGLDSVVHSPGSTPLLLAIPAVFELVALFEQLRGPETAARIGRARAGRTVLVMVGSFPVAALVGALLLYMPRSRADGVAPLTFVDAFFTATSAVCVTGLVVRDTGTELSVQGQNVVAALIQVGGLGIMTYAAFFTLLLGRGRGLDDRADLREVLGRRDRGGVHRLLAFMIIFPLAVEAIGALLLMDAWVPVHGQPFLERFRYSLFHTVSAFCNAGFALDARSLAPHASDPRVVVVMGGLIVIGGLGFGVHLELLIRCGRALRRLLRLPWRKNHHVLHLNGQAGSDPRRPLSLHTQLAMSITLYLLLGGTLGFMLLEHGAGGRLAQAAFLSVSSRTAGFETYPVGQLSRASLLFCMALMFIGASPGSTGGGIKTTTLAVIGATVRSMWRHQPMVDLRRRTIPQDVVRSAFVILSVSAGVLFAVVLLLLMLHPELRFEDLLFEAVSAFATVGLSTGITAELGVPARLLLCLTMFLGRLGPLSIMVYLTQGRRSLDYRYAEESLEVG